MGIGKIIKFYFILYVKIERFVVLCNVVLIVVGILIFWVNEYREVKLSGYKNLIGFILNIYVLKLKIKLVSNYYFL